MMLNDDPRAILGLRRGADADEIHAAYRVAAKRAHPDLGGSSEAFRRVRAAADCLLAELAAGGAINARRPYGEADRTSLEGDWRTISADLRAIWGLAGEPTTVIAPQKIGLSPFVTGVSLNPPAYQWLIRKVGPRGQDWDFHAADSVTRLFFRRADDARQFQLRFI